MTALTMLFVNARIAPDDLQAPRQVYVGYSRHLHKSLDH